MTTNDVKPSGSQFGGSQVEPVANQNRFLGWAKAWGPAAGGFTLLGTAIIAVVSFVVGQFFVTPHLHEVEQQIDAVERRLEDRIEGLEDAIDAKITDLDDDSDERMDGISVQLEGVRAQLELIVADLQARRSSGENDAD